jgi:hypothetical protein
MGILMLIPLRWLPYRELAAAYALAGKMDARTNPYPVPIEGLRKAGLSEE